MKRTVLVGIPHATQFSRIEFERSLYPALDRRKDDVNFEFVVSDLIMAITDDARNVLAARAIEQGFDDILFLDDDMIHPRYLLADLLKHRGDDKIIIGGMYASKFGNRIHAYQFRGIYYPMLLKANTGRHECDAIGTGCMLVPISVFRKMPFPWFYYKYSMLSDGQEKYATIKVGNKYLARWSEDMVFCYNAKRAGFKVYVDTDVVSLHLTSMAVGVDENGVVKFNLVNEL